MGTFNQRTCPSKKRVGITFGAFDLLHPGHVAMLEEAKTQCDYLIVGLHIDPSRERKEKSRPVMTAWERHQLLKANKFVDEIVPYETEQDLLNMLLVIKPDVRIIGGDYYGKDFTGATLCGLEGIEIYYNKRSHNYSSTELRNRIKKMKTLKEQVEFLLKTSPM